jgi:hypothetical protein
MLHDYWVFHERGGFIHVLAKNPKESIEQFFDSVKSMIGHQAGICSCFPKDDNKEKAFRENIIRPILVRDKSGQKWTIQEIEEMRDF